MSSKEKVARAKERISKSLNDVLYGTLYSQEENEEDEKILLQYIKELENKVEEAYYKGYIQKQEESIQICKKCKCREKSRKLETEKADTIEKLEKDIENANNNIRHMDEKSILQTIARELAIGMRDYANEILSIMKGEKNE